MTAKPKIKLFSLGGTIAMMPGSDGQGVVPTLDARALAASVPGLDQVADVEVETLATVGSANLSFREALRLADLIRELSGQSDVSGVVITQGTDTLEEMALTIDLLVDVDLPVVMTGAMRHPSLPGADGPANLLAACRVAASEEARGCGVLVVMNDEIHTARFVRKGHTSSTAAFISPSLGPVGSVCEDRVSILARIKRTPTFALGPDDPVPPVALLPAAFGSDGRLLDAVTEVGFDGLVIESFGAGHLARTVADRAEKLARHMPVILTSRVGGGRVHENTYGGEGNEMDLIKRGLIPAGHWDGRKGRILLQLLLANGAEKTTIREVFANA